MTVHVVEVGDGHPEGWSNVAQCSRCYIRKEIAETIVYVHPQRKDYKSHHVEAYDICNDCLPFVTAQAGNKEVERHRQKARENPFTSKAWDGRLEPYMHFNRVRWRTTNEIIKGAPGPPDFNVDDEPPIPGITTWLVGHDKSNNPIWEERPPS